MKSANRPSASTEEAIDDHVETWREWRARQTAAVAVARRACPTGESFGRRRLRPAHRRGRQAVPGPAFVDAGRRGRSADLDRAGTKACHCKPGKGTAEAGAEETGSRQDL